MSRGLLFIACVLLLVNLSHCGLQNGDMRLAGGKTSHEGRVEVYLEGVWGTVCDDDWDIKEALVVCRKLNFPSAREAVTGEVYGPGKGPIFFDNLNCLGTETDLTKCESPGIGISDCKHAEDAGVVCSIASTQRVLELSVEHSTTISGLLGQLFDSGRDCDVILSVVVENTTVETTICAHRLILSLAPGWSFLSSQDNLSIEVSSQCQPHVAYFVRYLYTGQINITMNSSQCIHKMASELGLKALQEEAGKMFTLLLPEDETFQTQSSWFDYAVSMDDEALRNSCLRYMAWNCEALVASPAWTNLSVHAIKALLSRTDLTVPSEYFVIQALERWEKAQGNQLGDQFDLLKLIRFPMVSAEDLNRLRDPRYQAGKLEGFQFHSLAIGSLFGELMTNWKSYTPRIYTGPPWSYTFTSQEVSNFRRTGMYSSQRDILAFTFHTPVHSSAYFALFKDMSWYTRLFVRSNECSFSGVSVCPSALLSSENSNSALPEVYKKGIVFKNKIVLRCDGQYVSHIQGFKHLKEVTMIPENRGSGQVYPCHSDQYSYTMVIRPKYSTGLNYTEVEED